MPSLGPCTCLSPLAERGTKFVPPGDRILVANEVSVVRAQLAGGQEPPSYEMAGPRERIYFDPSTRSLTAAIVTCGGICPGLNDVIRALVVNLWFAYGVKRILGIRYGYQGLTPASTVPPLALDPEVVDDIHRSGGSILSSSRGEQPPPVMVDYLVQQRIDILFAIGGDGTQRGALAITREIAKRGLKIAVVGVPKSVDNDISGIDRTFGFATAVSESRHAIVCAHNEAKGAPNGIGLVKLMGRHSGFIAAYATLANSEVNLVLVPEVPFKLEGPGGILSALEWRLRRRQHAVVVVAEGAGQDLCGATGKEHDASGNAKLEDIGLFLKKEFTAYFQRIGMEMNLKYIDPSYIIRSVEASADDSVFCLHLGQNAVHAAMSGETGVLIGLWHGQFTIVPLEDAIATRRVIDPTSWLWQSVLFATGQKTGLA